MIQQLSGNEEVARITLGIPHPYPDGAAEHGLKMFFSPQKEGIIMLLQ